MAALWFYDFSAVRAAEWQKVINKIPTATNGRFGAVFHRKQATNRRNCAFFAGKIVWTGRALSLLENEVRDVVSLQIKQFTKL